MAPHPRVPAADQPVARVLPFLRLSHLDRVFDYQVSEDDSAAAQPGVRVVVPFSGRRVDGIILSREEGTDFAGRLSYLHRVVSPEVVVPPETLALVDAIAQRYAGIRSEVIRLAVPPRHTAAEAADTSTAWEALGESHDPDLSQWACYQHGTSFVDAVLAGQRARVAWQVRPDQHWAGPLAALAVAVVRGGGGALLVVPDQRDVDKLERALREHVSARQITTLTAAQGPQARYRRFLSVLHGQGRLVIGTRSAAFAPVNNLRLCVIVHDGDPSHAEPRAPYFHAREVLTTRAAQCGASLIVAGYSRTAETQLLVESGWAHDLVAAPQDVAGVLPTMTAIDDQRLRIAANPESGGASIPGQVYRAMTACLESQRPVLVQIPRKGDTPVLACASCRAPARCRACNGPLEIRTHGDQPGVPTCRWCGRPSPRHRCAECGSPRLRAVVVGHQRTAEELGKAFASVRIVASGGARVLDEVDCAPAIVVATPGAEPEVSGGSYGVALLTDTWGMLQRPDLRATEEAFAAWTAASRLVAPARQGGEVLIFAPQELQVVQALQAWDVVGHARAELDSRRQVRFPPAAHLAAVDGAAAAVSAVLEAAALPEGAEILGPMDLPPGAALPGEYDERRYGPPQRMLVRAPLGPRASLGRALKDAAASWVAQGSTLPLRIHIDPVQVG
ncbi:primosomal protein N' [Corynebacterium sp. Marseille-Q2516]